ncbi:MAG: hypothetical protein KF861_06400 [Planctomycetaceae bacterium]|nr:hypothetical protein [Planctomycetaceae bacterium]
MSVRPFRFVHATNLRLDQPLWGIGSITPEARRIAEDATLLALGHIVTACIDHRASCLLLTGNCFDAVHAFRARMALESACERLAEHDIEVFIVPGVIDPAATWTNGIHLPPNVTTFDRRPSEPVAVVRDSEVLATVEPYEERARTSERGKLSSGLRIGLVGAGQHAALQTAFAATQQNAGNAKLQTELHHAAQYGYLALGNGSERVTVSLGNGAAHDPGCPQPLDGQRTHAGGCSLIEVDRSGRVNIQQIPTAIVRREEIELSLAEGDTWDQLVEQMQAALLDREPLPTEKLWLVRWMITADAALAASLASSSARDELCELVEQELADDRGVIRQHEVDIRSDWLPGDRAELSGSTYEEFLEFLSERLPAEVERFRGRLPGLDWPEAGWVGHLIAAGERIDGQAVVARTQDLARRHLYPTEAAASRD